MGLMRLFHVMKMVGFYSLSGILQALERNGKVNPRQLSHVLTELGKDRSALQACVWTFSWARARGEASVYHYNRYISILGRAGRWEQAVQVRT